VTDSPSQDRNPGAATVRPPEPVPPRLTLFQAASQSSGNSVSRFDLWLHRLTVLLFVFVCAVVGVLLVIVPWRPEWTDNRFFLTYPTLRDVFSNGFVRGLCSGLGVLDIWIGFWEAVHYHEGNHGS
jgi:hypothetical protein